MLACAVLRVDADRTTDDHVAEVERSRHRRHHDNLAERAAVVGAGEIDLAGLDRAAHEPAPTVTVTVPICDALEHVPAFACASPHSGTPASCRQQALGQRRLQARRVLFAVLTRELQHERAVPAGDRRRPCPRGSRVRTAASLDMLRLCRPCRPRTKTKASRSGPMPARSTVPVRSWSSPSRRSAGWRAARADHPGTSPSPLPPGTAGFRRSARAPALAQAVARLCAPVPADFDRAGLLDYHTRAGHFQVDPEDLAFFGFCFSARRLSRLAAARRSAIYMWPRSGSARSGVLTSTSPTREFSGQWPGAVWIFAVVVRAAIPARPVTFAQLCRFGSPRS